MFNIIIQSSAHTHGVKNEKLAEFLSVNYSISRDKTVNAFS